MLFPRRETCDRVMQSMREYFNATIINSQGGGRMFTEISISIPDVAGELDRVLDIFANNKINLLAFSINQVAPYSVVRFICTKPDLAYSTLRHKAFIVERHDIFALKLPNKSGELKRVTEALSAQHINIEYGYLTVIDGTDQAIVLIKTNDKPKAEKVFKRINVPDLRLIAGVVTE